MESNAIYLATPEELREIVVLLYALLVMVCVGVLTLWPDSKPKRTRARAKRSCPLCRAMIGEDEEHRH